MSRFVARELDVLLATSIIESGLDIPTANTIIVNRADHFGLAQLYQIRGRVGRSRERAYAYLLVPARRPVTKDARLRLEVLQRFTELGSGFAIASHDLEIRGAGNLLGKDQSGQIEAVGFDLYSELLDEAVRELRGRGAAARHGPGRPAAGAGLHPRRLHARRPPAALLLQAARPGLDRRGAGGGPRRDRGPLRRHPRRARRPLRAHGGEGPAPGAAHPGARRRAGAAGLRAGAGRRARPVRARASTSRGAAARCASRRT